MNTSDLRKAIKLQQIGFISEDDKFVLKVGKYKTVVDLEKKTYKDNIDDNPKYKKSIEKDLNALGFERTSGKVKSNFSDYIEKLKKNKFEYDEDVEAYCADFKTHSVCINDKFEVSFYCDDKKDFMKDQEGRVERWKKRFRDMGISNLKITTVEEYE